MSEWVKSIDEPTDALGNGRVQRHKSQIDFKEIIGKSPAIEKVRSIIKLIANTDANILIYGETGTGKELVARKIYASNTRALGHFVPVDCAALPPSLLESELFGFEKGAFTGAVGKKHGLIEFADNGTLFLDEIAELAPNLQAKLLRVLQEQQFRRIGGKKLLTVKLRVVSAMNINPSKAVGSGRLRKDLYYRLNVIPIYIPPLRQRRDDIPSLARYFVDAAVRKNHLAPKTISTEAMDALLSYAWPGNVRQLQNLMERLALLTQGETITATELPRSLDSGKNGPRMSNYAEEKRRHLETFKKKYFLRLIKSTNYNIPEAAAISGMSERTIYRFIERYGKL